MAKQGPLATCQAKIHQRRLRPGSEYCHDEVDDQLAREQRNLLDLINKLEAGLGQVTLQIGPLSLVEVFRGFAVIGCDHGVAMPALWCHKDAGWLPITERIYYRRPHALNTQRNARNALCGIKEIWRQQLL